MPTDQPAPTSSLEEARSLDDLWDDYEGVLNAYTFASGADRTRLAERAAVLRDDIKAAARADVIREVEALGRAYSRNTGEGLLIATIVRALSQGGEGEA